MTISTKPREASLKKVLDAFKRGETPKPGPQVDPPDVRAEAALSH